jgi:hypothetical protein
LLQRVQLIAVPSLYKLGSICNSPIIFSRVFPSKSQFQQQMPMFPFRVSGSALLDGDLEGIAQTMYNRFRWWKRSGEAVSSQWEIVPLDRKVSTDG